MHNLQGPNEQYSRKQAKSINDTNIDFFQRCFLQQSNIKAYAKRI